MRNRTILSLIEMLIMVMVFAVAAAICLRAFVWSDLTSRDSKEQAEAAMRAQAAAELIQHCEGDIPSAAAIGGGAESDGSWIISYDADWQETAAGSAVYTLTVKPEADGANAAGVAQDTETAYLGSAEITVADNKGAEILTIPVKWQITDGKGVSP